MTAAISVGLARAAYGAAVRYARERVAFGSRSPSIRPSWFQAGDMLTSLHRGSPHDYQAAARPRRRRVVTREPP